MNQEIPNSIARLVWKVGDDEKDQVVPPNGITIGRSVQNNLVIQDTAASRFNSKILPDSGAFRLVDLESTNGTFLNGNRISESVVLNDGDEIQIGEHLFRVEISIPEPAAETIHEAIVELPLGETFVVPVETDSPWLMISSGVGKGTIFTLSKKQFQIGRASRDKQWDIDLVDKAVSRPHAEIIQEADQWVLKDLGSANGTSVNGKTLIEPHILENGDVLNIGETVMVFRLKGDT
jgi:pSer/pThr/pTyr-binding forkhead associated (FHA) protein